jgi:hypothetical protein
MLSLYCADGRYRERIETLASAGREVRSTDEWRQFERTAPATQCSVVVVASPAADPALRRLPLLKARHPRHPVVLVVRGGRAALAGAGDLAVEEVVALEALERELPPALGRVRVLAELRALGALTRQAEHLPAKLREALSLTCNGGAPIRTVDRLASVVGCDRRTLWNQWRQAVGPGARLRLQDFIHWLLVLRAASRKAEGRSWADVADEIGIHPHTLGRLARQLAGSSLRDLAAGGCDRAAQRFRLEVVDTVLGRPSAAPEPRRHTSDA